VSETEPTRVEQVTKLLNYISGYHVTHLLEIARELGVWEIVTAEPGVTASELARRVGADPFYVDVLCRTAFAFDLLARERDGWRMAPHFDQILGTPEGTFYLGRAGQVHIQVGRDYTDMPRRFREGSIFPFQDHDAEFIEAVAASLKTLPRLLTDFVLPKMPKLERRFAEGARVLDVGCGAGWALVHLAERFPKTKCVGVDIEPRSIELANDLIRSRRLGDRCEARVMSAEGLAEDRAYDIATSFLVVHEIPPTVKEDAFRGVARCLVPGGSFVIFDETYPETDEALRTMPTRFAALAQWFELTWGNRINTRTEVDALCAQAGLRITDETTYSRFSILVATKEESETGRRRA
jgi:SAM-dependent methyltransferase